MALLPLVAADPLAAPQPLAGVGEPTSHSDNVLRYSCRQSGKSWPFDETKLNSV
jgi:hypothetical protein